MKLFLLIPLMGLSSLKVCAQEKDIQITESRKFKISHANDIGSVLLNLKATYYSKGDTFKIYKDDVRVFGLSSPLNLHEFRDSISMVLNDGQTAAEVFSEYGINEIFFWLYSIRNDDNQPNIGVLNLGLLTRCENDSSEGNDTLRAYMLESISNVYNQRVASIGVYKKKYQQKYDQWKLSLRGTTMINDTLETSPLLKKFNDELYPDINLINNMGLIINRKKTNTLAEFNKNDSLYVRYKAALDSLYNTIDSMKKWRVFPIEKVSLQFERGHIERIQAWVKNSRGGTDIYENTYAIGFTSINNLKAFQKTRLIIRKSTKAGFNRWIYLSDVVGNYDNLLDLYTRDYSPADTVINNINPGEMPIVTLKKQQSIRLLDGKIFTDLAGIDEESPNGLIQIELCRRFNLNTYRWQAGRRANISTLSYVNVNGAISKIENKQKYLELKNSNVVVNNTLVSPSYTTNLDLKRYENASLGLDLNTFLFDFPDMKFTAYVDVGFRYGHVKMLDSVRNIVDNKAIPVDDTTFTGHTATLMLPKITLEIFQERRVGLTMCYSYNYTYALTNNKFKQIVSYKKSDLNDIKT